MNRRTALNILLSSAAGAALSRTAFAAPRKVVWKTAIGLNGFMSSGRKYKKTYPIWEILDYASNKGFEGVELVGGWPQGDYPSADEPRRIAALKRLYDAYGLQVFSIQTGAGGAFAPDKATRLRWIRHQRDRLRFAKAVGCECVGMWPGGGLRGQSIGEAIGHLSDSFREIARTAAELGLIAAFEIEPPFVFNQERHMKQILEKTHHPNLKVIYDPSHFDLMNGSTGRPHEMLRRIGVDQIGYVQFTDADGTLRDGGTSKHLGAGDGHIDVQASLKLLKDGGFEGWIMMDTWEVPDPYDASTKGIEAVATALATR